MQGQGISPSTNDDEINEESKAIIKTTVVTPSFIRDFGKNEEDEEYSEYLEEVNLIF
jgi:hypothetical protein